MTYPTLTLALPDWLDKHTTSQTMLYDDIDSQMAFVVSLARENVAQGTGGPFAAAVFDASGKLIAPGVNLVTSRQCSVFHAEMVALMLAQKILERFDLSDGGQQSYTLTSSVEPCAMCFGAIPWSGISRLVCGARDVDAREVGFDEGAKIKQWRAALLKRGISVTRDVRRSEAKQVLLDYAQSGGDIYNASTCRC